MKCPSCAYDNPSGLNFCGMCGVRLTRACPACGGANPPEFRFCGHCGVSLGDAPPPPPVESRPPPSPPPSPPPLAGERRPATILFADVTGSTELLQRLGSEAWVKMMNRLLQILEAEVYRFGGEVNQFRGDGLVAFFGAGTAHEDDPERAVLAGLAMQQAIRPYAAELTASAGVTPPINLQLRVGVHTGEVIVASIGDSRRYSENTAMGEALALAARMETAAPPGAVLVSRNTYRLTQSRFEWESLGEIMVKGVNRPIPVYRPLRPLPEAGRPHPQAHGLSTPLIGREAEFEALKTCLENLCAGRGAIVMVIGDEGMGKSYLAAQARQHFARAQALRAEAGIAIPCAGDVPSTLTWLQGRCRSYDQALPYSMWLDLLQNWLGVREGEPKEETRDRLRLAAQTLWGDQMVEHYPYLAALLALPLEEEFAERVRHWRTEEQRQRFFSVERETPPTEPGGEGVRQQIFTVVRSWAEAMARRGPLVLAFEDVHWADATSLQLLEYCLPLCDQSPTLWLALFRQDRASPAWEFHHRAETAYPHRVATLPLSPLNEAQSREFVHQLLGRETLPAEMAALIVDKAEGNPYYIQEIVRTLIEQGTLAQEAETGRWRVARAVASLDLPDSLQSLMLARMDRCLSPEERRVLQMAAVIGPVFWFNVLEALADDGLRGTLRARLTALQRAQMIQERGQVADLGMEYVFKSSLIRDAAYESLLSDQRSAHHLKVAHYLESLPGPEMWAQHYGAMAYHYRQAGDLGKELFYTIQAAEQARRVYANAEALRLYTRALEIMDHMETQQPPDGRLYAICTQRFEVLNERREIFYLMGDIAAMWADAQALLPLARRLEDDPAWLIDALLQQPGVAGWRTREDFEAGIPMAQQALALARQIGDRRREMQALLAVARHAFWNDDPTWKEHAEHALEIARQLGDRRSEASILIGMGQVYASSEPAQSMGYLAAALPISQALNDRITELEILQLLGAQWEDSDDYCRRLTECHEKELRLSREIGHRPAEIHALMFSGQIRGVYLGDHDRGLALLEEGLSLCGGMATAVFFLLRIAQIRVMQGLYEEAKAVLERARSALGPHVAHIGHVGLDLVSAILCNALGDAPHLQQALELTARNREVFVDNPPLSRQYRMVAACEASAAHLGLARLLADTAERETHLRQALESSRTAVEIYQEAGAVRPVECVSEEILYRRSLALAANGLHAEAAAYLTRARAEMRRKHELIPPDSPFRRTYLENIPLHRQIQAATAAARPA